MRRRDLLSALAGCGVAGLAGCTDRGPGPGRTVSLADRDPVPEAAALRIDVTVVESAVTDDHTARLRLTTTNTGERRAFSIGTNGCELLNRDAGGSDDPPGLWLNDPGRADRLDRAGDRWERDRPADRERGYDGYGCSPRPFDPGESVHNEYVLWDDYRVDGYLDPGTYRWAETVSTHAIDEAGNVADDPTVSFRWGFSLSVERRER